MEKGYIVLTPEKIEDIFGDLDHLIVEIDFLKRTDKVIQSILESKKQELLKSIKK
jgi:hypothetical protein